MKALISIFVSGVVFALGLGISGMADANKVIGFLNLAGDWDPSLAFVMAGAIGVHLVLYRLILRRSSPLLGRSFGIPTRKDVDGKLVLGAALFGVGWGLGGFCPGPAIISSVTLGAEALVFIAAMTAGMWAFQLTQTVPTPNKEAS